MQNGIRRIVSGIAIVGALVGVAASNVERAEAAFRDCTPASGQQLSACALHNTAGTLIGSGWYQNGHPDLPSKDYLGAFDHVFDSPSNLTCEASIFYVSGLPVTTLKTTVGMIGQTSSTPQFSLGGWYDPIGLNTTPQTLRINCF
jgi:hypothetical protein